VVCTNGSRVSDVRRKHSELAGIGSSPSNAHYSRKSKRLVRPHLSCRDRVKGVFTPSRRKVSHFNDRQQKSRAAWGKSFSFAESRFNGVGRRKLPVSMRLSARGT